MSSKIEMSREFHASLMKNSASVAWQDVTSPGTSKQTKQYFGGSGELQTYEKVFEQFGRKAADAWRKAEEARKEFFAATSERIKTFEQGETVEESTPGVQVKALRWSDEQPGTRGHCREQADGQLELYTLCGRYVIRSRKGVDGDMWVPRYLGNLPLSVRPTLKQAKHDAQADHECRIREEINLGGEEA